MENIFQKHKHTGFIEVPLNIYYMFYLLSKPKKSTNINEAFQMYRRLNVAHYDHDFCLLDETKLTLAAFTGKEKFF